MSRLQHFKPKPHPTIRMFVMLTRTPAPLALFGCPKCGRKIDLHDEATTNETRRGILCPTCNRGTH